MPQPPEPAFDSPEEFADPCRAIVARLHHLDRVAISEQQFAWQVADMMSRVGATFRDRLDDAGVRATFGDGRASGTIPRDAQARTLFDQMYADRTR